MSATIKAFDRATCGIVAKRVQDALATLATELGVVINVRGGSYTPGQYTCKLEIATVSDDGTVKTRAAEAFTTLARLYGMSPDDLGKTFRMNGEPYTITGLATRRSKRPVIAKNGKGKEYVFAVEDVKRALLPIGGK